AGGVFRPYPPPRLSRGRGARRGQPHARLRLAAQRPWARGGMRFALLGSHADGVAMASALVASGRHELVYFTAAAGQTWPAGARQVHDLEEVLADPAVEAVLVGRGPAHPPPPPRPPPPSERPALCRPPAPPAPAG